MFTGLVEEVGNVKGIMDGAKSSKIIIHCVKIMNGIKLGDSIAVNGVCLTVTGFTKEDFTVDVMAETLRKTNLGSLKKGSSVNLERALQLGERFGGHIVSGHIDDRGKIVSKLEEDIATWVKIKINKNLLRYIVDKGSVAVDGISLTVAQTEDDYFMVSLIPHTKGETTLHHKKIGEEVNIECDVIGKYVEKLMIKSDEENSDKRGITTDFLKENGFV